MPLQLMEHWTYFMTVPVAKEITPDLTRHSRFIELFITNLDDAGRNLTT